MSLLAMVSLTAACAGRMVDPDRGAHGNLGAELARGEARWTTRSGPPTAILIERSGVRAVNPDSGQELWWSALHVIGHPAADADTIYLPLRGHRLVAVDRRSGVMRWSTHLPGEALTGLCVGDGVVVAVIVDGGHRSRSRVVALSTEDAVLRWQRRSHERFGTPAARRNAVNVSLGSEVLAFRIRSGRELARVSLRAGDKNGASPRQLERLQTQDDTLVLGGGNRFVNLASASGGRAPEVQRVDSGHGWIFDPIEGLDPGHNDAERLRLWVRFVVSGDAPRAAVLLARRAVVAMRLGPDGRPIRALWVHQAAGREEYVAMDVTEDRVTLVQEDGAIVHLDARDGTVLTRWPGKRPTRGALLVGASRTGKTATAGKTATPDAALVRQQLVALFGDGDPRLHPAHVLAADLLWRSDDVSARATVEALADGSRTVGYGDPAAGLQAHALTLISGPWGAADAAELEARLAALSDRPSFLAGRSLQLATVARAAVHSGNREMVPHLVGHLLHPATAASDLTEIAGALATLGGEAATAGLAAFVRRYHADPEIVYESRALHVAVDYLADDYLADDDGAGDSASPATSESESKIEPADTAEATLDAALRDPFTEPELRAYIAQHVARDRASVASLATNKATRNASVSAPASGDTSDSGRIPPPLPTVQSEDL
ncbi:MAG: PQQ-binding-like beta-propeller repeat protein [Nannocystaceae bacterium]|nr:PQQ-binding-like beta-propeller repeat protein [Nannocystaceae bacterium]